MRTEALGNGSMKVLKVFFICLVLESWAFGAEMEWISRPQWTADFIKGDSRRPALSRDGQIVVFQSEAPLVKNSSKKAWHIYSYDRKEKVLKQISPAETKDIHGGPAISSDGRLIAFHVYPESVVKGEPPRTSQVYIYNRPRDRYEQISIGWKGAKHDGEALYPQLDGNGKKIVFTSNATNLLKDEKAPFRAVYLFSRKKNRIKLLSKNTEGDPANRTSVQPLISDDGHWAAYKSAATNLEPSLEKSSLAYHLYLRDLKNDDQVRVDLEKWGFDPQKWRVGRFSMDQKGKNLVFEGFVKISSSIPHPDTSSELFLFDVAARRMTMLTGQYLGKNSRGPVVNGDGRFVAFVFGGTSENDPGGVVVWDRQSNLFQKIFEGTCENLSFSFDGGVLAFESSWPHQMNRKNSDSLQIYVVSNPFQS